MPRSADFSDAVKTAALRRANFTCQAVDCGWTDAWREFWRLIGDLKIRVRPRGVGSATGGWLSHVAAKVRAEHSRQRRGVERLSRYRLAEGPDALLQVDHIREAADGGAATMENAQVLCIVCHLDKTATRGRVRRKGPQVAKKYEQRRAG